MKNMPKLILCLIGETNVNREQPNTAFELVQEYLSSADIRLGHMETLLSNAPSQDPERPDLPYKPLWRFSKPENAEAWKTAGIDAVSLASNITSGDEAIDTTIKKLDMLGIQHCGIGHDLKEAHTPAIVAKNGIKVGMLSYTSVFWPFLVPAGQKSSGAAVLPAVSEIIPSPRTVEMPGAVPAVETRATPEALALLRQDVKELRKQVDIVVVSCHWGISSSQVTCAYQRQLAHAAIEAGADMVMGHHPHRIQGIEIYNGKPIFYSLGNFAFDWFKMKGKSKEGLCVKAEFEGENRTIRLRFFHRNGDNNIDYLSLEKEEGRLFLSKLEELSLEYGTSFVKQGEELTLKGR